MDSKMSSGGKGLERARSSSFRYLITSEVSLAGGERVGEATSAEPQELRKKPTNKKRRSHKSKSLLKTGLGIKTLRWVINKGLGP